VRWSFVAAVIALSALLAVVAGSEGAGEAGKRARLASKRLHDGRIVRVTGSETSDGACIAVRLARGTGEFCGLAAPARDEVMVAESYGGGVTAFVIYAGRQVRAVRVEMRSGDWRTRPLHRAEGASGMDWFQRLRFGLLIRRGAVTQPTLMPLGRDGKPL
jgi:hypothetical protein